MASHTIELDAADYEALERAASGFGLSVRAFLLTLIGKEHEPETPDTAASRPGRWARLSERVRRDPPLHGAGEHVRRSSRLLREDFALTRDDLDES